MMQLIDFLSNYASYDDVEEGAVRSFRQFLQTYGDRAYARDNLTGHLVVSAWIVNKELNKVLMIHHNLYNSWAWVGGHADGDKNLLRVALKETAEETGLKNVRAISENPFDFNVLAVHNHIRNGSLVPTHLHYNVVYLLEADEKDALFMKPDENSGVKWIDFDKVCDYCNEKIILPYYERLIKKLNERKL